MCSVLVFSNESEKLRSLLSESNHFDSVLFIFDGGRRYKVSASSLGIHSPQDLLLPLGLGLFRSSPFWWLAKTCLFLVTQPLTNQLLTKFCSVRQIPEGTKTGQNHRKIKSRTPCSEYPHLNICYSGAKVQICPVKNESKRIKFTSIVHFLFSCTTMDNTNRFLPRLDGLAPKSRVKICFVASGSHVRRKCVGLYRHSARSFAGKRKPCIFKYRKLDETDTEKVSDRPTDNLPADGRKSRQMGKLNIYKSIISR